MKVSKVTRRRSMTEITWGKVSPDDPCGAGAAAVGTGVVGFMPARRALAAALALFILNI
jgi:hypothetical protein